MSDEERAVCDVCKADFPAYLAADGVKCYNPRCEVSEMITSGALGRIIIEQREEGVHTFFYRSDTVPMMQALRLALKMIQSAANGLPGIIQAQLARLAQRN